MDDAVIEWFDSHCHLQDEFTESDGSARADGPHATRLAATIARASEAGVTRMVCVGTAAGSSREAVALARSMREPESVAVAEGIELWATIGLHPHDAVDGVDSLDELLLREVGSAAGSDGRGGAGGSPVVVGIGECGLDYHYDHSPRADQREAFARQIGLAHRHGLALVVHTREAWDDTLDILAAEGVPDRTVIHCFTGGPTEARRCLDLGAFLSFSGVVTFKNADPVREAAALCPLDRLLVETDTPFLTPVPHRGTLNEPSRVPLVGAAIAQLKGVSTSHVADVSTAGARALFAL
ncbi:MAG: TatD family hydrolase [Acidimicrobiales bacterium]|jgi:TatD DNase family protein